MSDVTDTMELQITLLKGACENMLAMINNLQKQIDLLDGKVETLTANSKSPKVDQ